MTSFTWTSRHARTQRVHWMHASRFTAIAGCERSCRGCSRRAKRGVPMPSFAFQVASSSSSLYTRSGMSAARSSTIIFCEWSARGLLLVTSMPAAGLRQHDGASTRSPLISTMHERQLPSGRMPGL